MFTLLLLRCFLKVCRFCKGRLEVLFEAEVLVYQGRWWVLFNAIWVLIFCGCSGDSSYSLRFFEVDLLNSLWAFVYVYVWVCVCFVCVAIWSNLFLWRLWAFVCRIVGGSIFENVGSLWFRASLYAPRWSCLLVSFWRLTSIHMLQGRNTVAWRWYYHMHSCMQHRCHWILIFRLKDC